MQSSTAKADALYRFSEDGQACVIRTPAPPRHWYNYLWNDLGFCAQVSQGGHGRCSYSGETGGTITLNRDAARYLYLRDEEDKSFWSPGYLPLSEPLEAFSCTHALAYSRIESQNKGIGASWRIFVPQNLYGEIWTIRLTNHGDRPRQLSLFSLTSFSLDGFVHPRYYEAYRGLETGWDPELQGIYCSLSHPFAPHKRCNGFLASSIPADAWDGDLTAFVGSASTRTELDTAPSALYQRPEVLIRGKDCTGSSCALFIPGAVLQHKITIQPGESTELRFLLGMAESPDEARTAAAVLRDADAVENLFQEARRTAETRYSKLSLHTPDPKLNTILTRWAQKQIDFCLVGKKGVRDNLQIAAAMLSFRPDRAAAEVLECLSHQFRDGHAVLTWEPMDDTRYSDQPFWLIWAVCLMLRETGDRSLLSQVVPWQDGGQATVLEHVKAAVYCLLADKGPHGLISIRYADWNDALNIPLSEHGESVMLSEQTCLCLSMLEDVMRWVENEDCAAFLHEARTDLAACINRYAWDGQWYLRALADRENIGSRDSSGSMIYLNAQTWAVLADVADETKLLALLQAVDAMEMDFGFPLNDPPYERYEPMAGRMSGMLPGLFENGGVYCHASAFKILMDCKLGRGDDALRTLRKILPDSPWNPSTQSGAEPYVFTNCYATHPKYYGRSYQSWTTSTSAWCLRGLYEGILGVRAELEGLVLQPSLPTDWTEAYITRPFRGAVYEITLRKPAGRPSGMPRIAVDGVPQQGNLLPDFRDGKTHLVIADC